MASDDRFPYPLAEMWQEEALQGARLVKSTPSPCGTWQKGEVLFEESHGKRRGLAGELDTSRLHGSLGQEI